MQIICLDFETFFSKEYNLSKLTTEAYIRDPRFEVHGCAIKWDNNHRAKFFVHSEVNEQFSQIDWSNTAVMCHHAHFDGLILNHHYNCVPKYWLDTLSMARLLVGNHLPLGLDALAKHFELGSKSMPYHMLRDLHWHEMDDFRRSAMAEGAKQDCELTWRCFARLQHDFPAEEYDVVDMTVRMFTEPKLIGDRELLAKIWWGEENRRQALWDKLGIDGEIFRSNGHFAELLKEYGIEVQMKDGKNGPIPAVAKNDDFLQELLNDEDETIADLAQARIDSKSTAIQARAAILGNMAMRGPLCVYLFAYGAHTTRWSGGDGTNFQNLKRGHGIRKTIQAPSNYLLAVPDQSQIECRILNYLAGQTDVIDNFRNGYDPYIGIASQFYGRDITKADEAERGTGKQAELSCGYGCGANKFKRTARLGSYGPSVDLSIEDATRAVYLYRNTHKAVVNYWRQADRILAEIDNGRAGVWGPMTYRDRRIILPNGAPLLYDTLGWHLNETTGEHGWSYKTRNGHERMWGSKLVEQTTQALARVTASQAMLRIRKAGFSVVGTSHDEAWVLIPDDANSAEAAQFCRQEMMRVPEWLPGIPLEAEVKVGKHYEK